MGSGESGCDIGERRYVSSVKSVVVVRVGVCRGDVPSKLRRAAFDGTNGRRVSEGRGGSQSIVDASSCEITK